MPSFFMMKRASLIQPSRLFAKTGVRAADRLAAALSSRAFFAAASALALASASALALAATFAWAAAAFALAEAMTCCAERCPCRAFVCAPLTAWVQATGAAVTVVSAPASAGTREKATAAALRVATPAMDSLCAFVRRL